MKLETIGCDWDSGLGHLLDSQVELLSEMGKVFYPGTGCLVPLFCAGTVPAIDTIHILGIEVFHLPEVHRERHRMRQVHYVFELFQSSEIIGRRTQLFGFALSPFS